MSEDLRAPFPYFGGKSRAAPMIWDALGDVDNYIEPFAGSLATLLLRPHAPRVETVNDLDCFVANFWRAVSVDADAVARYADHPVNEADLHARHAWLISRTEWRERMLTDPDYYDAKVAGWWCWGLSLWIGSGFCAKPSAGRQIVRLATQQGVVSARATRQAPRLTGSQGVQRGSVISRKLPNVDGLGGKGVAHANPSSDGLRAWFASLQARLRAVRVCCGDWQRVLTPTVLRSGGVTGVLLDPPYLAEGRAAVYTEESADVAHAVREWAIAHGDDPSLRIVLCGYEGEHAMPPSWRVVEWKGNGSYGKAGTRASENRHRERLWLSPHCMRSKQLTLFSSAGASR